MKFAILVAIWPDEAEVKRLKDLVDSLLHYEPECNCCVLVNDGVPDAQLRAAAAAFGTRAVILPNPRRGRGFGFTGGLTVGILAGLEWIEKQSDIDFVVKLDPDSLIIGPFAKRIHCLFAANPEIGQAGTYRKYPDGTENFSGLDWGALIERLYRPLTYWSPSMFAKRRLQIGLAGRDRKIRRIIREALLNGYALGDCCQGGGYAVSRAALRAFREKGYFEDPHLFLNSPLGEDITVGLLIKAAGLRLKDFNQPGEVFGVKFKGLCAQLSDLVSKNYGVIHSVKDFEDLRESEVRSFFQARRS